MKAQYQLKGIKEWDTHDGGGFTARVYRGGKCVGSVINHGTGGSNCYDVEPEIVAELTALAVANDPDADRFGEGADAYIDELLERADMVKTLNKWARTKVLFLLDDEDPFTFGCRNLVCGHAVTDRDMSVCIAQLKLKYGDEHRVRVWNRGIEEWIAL